MARLLGSKIGEGVCKILGLDPSDIAKLDIRLRAGDVATIEITRYLQSEELVKIEGVLEKYEITAVKNNGG